MPVRLHLLGSPTVASDRETLALPFERRSQLLALLAVRRAWVGRAEIAAMLWPDQDSRLAYTNLRKTLHRLQGLPWASGIEVQGGALRFEAPTDVLDFEAALREGRTADAVRLRRGEFLAGFDDDRSEAWTGWLGFERERLRAAWRGAALEHLEADIDPAEAVELSARLLESDPLDESALRAHMAWLARGGKAAQARQAYRDFVARLAADLGLAPGAQLLALHDSLAARPAPASPVSPARAAGEDGFVGRSVELRQLTALLDTGGCRLVSLIGPGGVGKTRLAARVLAELAPRHPDGTAFIALEDAATRADIAGRIARGLEIALAGRRDAFDQVVDHLRERHVLLALDNFEHLAGDAPLLERLLADCPHVRLVVTSRARLGIAAEQLLPLEGLPCPDPEDQDRFEAFDAVRLFVKAARRVEPALVPETEAAAIIDICRQVEGLPLAIELAASWTRLLSCEAIAAQLREGTQLLHAAGATQPSRHASMEVVFEASWRLLGPLEREALARLSVFHGGFTAEAARAVAGASLPVLGALVDKSLLRKEKNRLHLHPLVQQLAAQRLGRGAAQEEAQRAHALHFHRLMAQLRRGIEDADREAMQVMDTEFRNCRSAWVASTPALREAVAKSAPALLNFCDHRVRLDEGLALFRDALASPAAQADPALQALLLASAAHLEYRLDRYAEAEANATRALAATGSGAGLETRLQCLKVLGACALRRGRHADAKRYFNLALKQAPASVDPHNAAAMLDNLALAEKAMGHYAQSLRLSQQSLVQHRRLKDAAGEALCLNNLGALQNDRGDREAGRAHLLEGLALCERHGLASTRALILANLTEVALLEGDTEAAGHHARRALEALAGTGNRALVAWLKLQTAGIALRLGDLPAARIDLADSLELAIAMDRPSLQFSGVACFAEILAAQGEPDCARRVLAFAAGHPAISVPDREAALARLAHLPAPAHVEPAWPGLELDELVHRIVVERPVAHAPLLALMRAQETQDTRRSG